MRYEILFRLWPALYVCRIPWGWMKKKNNIHHLTYTFINPHTHTVSVTKIWKHEYDYKHTKSETWMHYLVCFIEIYSRRGKNQKKLKKKNGPPKWAKQMRNEVNDDLRHENSWNKKEADVHCHFSCIKYVIVAYQCRHFRHTDTKHIGNRKQQMWQQDRRANEDRVGQIW